MTLRLLFTYVSSAPFERIERFLTRMFALGMEGNCPRHYVRMTAATMAADVLEEMRDSVRHTISPDAVNRHLGDCWPESTLGLG